MDEALAMTIIFSSFLLIPLALVIYAVIAQPDEAKINYCSGFNNSCQRMVCGVRNDINGFYSKSDYQFCLSSLNQSELSEIKFASSGGSEHG